MFTVNCIVPTVQPKLYLVHNTIVGCTLCSVHCEVCSVHCEVCSVHCEVYSVHCEVCSVHPCGVDALRLALQGCYQGLGERVGKEGGEQRGGEGGRMTIGLLLSRSGRGAIGNV